MAKVNFDLKGFDSEREAKTDLLPDCEVNAEIHSTEVKETKSKKGAYIQVFFKVVAGAHKGKMFQETLNLWNDSADAIRIAAARLKRIMEVGGHKNPNGVLGDSDELVGLKMRFRIEQVKRLDDKGKEQTYNEVKKVMAFAAEAFDGAKQAEAIGAPAANPMAPAQPAAPAAGTTVPPWMRGK